MIGIALKDFYSTLLGRMVQRYVNKIIRNFWPEVTSNVIVGIGYPTPYLNCWLDQDDNHISVFMPAKAGVMQWPNHTRNVACLTDETMLPMKDNSVDRVVVSHALEHCYFPRALLQEIWRVLAPGGRLLLIVPNRTSIWARVESTPFGHGQPYSMRQISKLLRKSSFSITQTDMALYFPPSKSRFILKLSAIWEKICHFCLYPLGGVIVIEAEKQLYAMRPEWQKAKKTSRGFVTAKAITVSRFGSSVTQKLGQKPKLDTHNE